MKYIYPLALLAAFLIVGGVALASYAAQHATVADSVPWTTITPTTPLTATTTTSATTTTTTTKPSGFTLADVAQHATASSCWTAINGSVYDLTPFIPAHPGGEQIVAVCGIDGTSLFEGQHGNNRQANAELARLRIGALVP